MTQKININVKQVFLAFLSAVLLSSAFLVASPQRVDAAVNECSTLPSDKGLATHTEPSVGSGNYNIYARVKVASGAATFKLSIDGDGGALCDYQVSQTGSNGNWVWFNSGSQKLDWTGGDMRFQMSGDKNGVGLDCVVLFDTAQGGAFNPTTKEDCNPTTTGSNDTGTPGPGGNDTGTTTGCSKYDLNGDNSVNIFDVIELIANRSSTDSKYDLNGDGSANIFDVIELIANRNCSN